MVRKAGRRGNPILAPSDKAHLPTQADSRLLEKLVAVRRELALPGYWTSLEANCHQWAKDITVSKFWAEAAELLPTWSSDYRSLHGDALLAYQSLPPFVGKPAARCRDKLCQWLRNASQPAEALVPAKGPPIPRLNDLVRTRVSCKYLDGVQFLANRLVGLAKRHGLKHEWHRRGLLQGYFAQHVTIELPVIFRFAGAVEAAPITCEIQLATVLATRIWETSHSIYESARSHDDEPSQWQWDPDDPRFVSRQLGHVIHLADGLLVQLRRSNSRPKKEKG